MQDYPASRVFTLTQSLLGIQKYNEEKQQTAATLDYNEMVASMWYLSERQEYLRMLPVCSDSGRLTFFERNRSF